MSKLDEEFWSDKDVKPEWAKDNQAVVMKRSELPAPWEVQREPQSEDIPDNIFEPKVKINLGNYQPGVIVPFDPVYVPFIQAPVTVTDELLKSIRGQSEQKDSNPKDAFGNQKLQLNVVPGCLEEYASLAFLEGALKYGRYNWRVKGVRVSVYLDALKRHIKKYEEGQWADPKTKVPHLANAIACLTIILDAGLMGSLIDDRPPSLPDHDKFIDGLSDIVTHLKTMFKDENPKQYTIADTPSIALNAEETCPKS